MEPNDIVKEPGLLFQPVDAESAAMEWTAEGRIFWRGREVETDDALRGMVREIHSILLSMVPTQGDF